MSRTDCPILGELSFKNRGGKGSWGEPAGLIWHPASSEMERITSSNWVKSAVQGTETEGSESGAVIRALVVPTFSIKGDHHVWRLYLSRDFVWWMTQVRNNRNRNKLGSDRWATTHTGAILLPVRCEEQLDQRFIQDFLCEGKDFKVDSGFIRKSVLLDLFQDGWAEVWTRVTWLGLESDSSH